MGGSKEELPPTSFRIFQMYQPRKTVPKDAAGEDLPKTLLFG
jgi:hypothetical protein